MQTQEELMENIIAGNHIPSANRRALTFDEACEYLGRLSRPSLYKLISEGEINSYKIGRKRYVLKDECDRFLDRLSGTEKG